MEEGWIDWQGGNVPPVSGETEVEVEFRNGERDSSRPANQFRWYLAERGSGVAFDIVKYRLTGDGTVQQPAPTTSDGGSSDYYKLTIKNKAGEEFSCEMGDIIRDVYGNDFNLGNIAKAARRMHLAAKGSGKAGTTVTYDANKIKYFADEVAFWYEVM